MNKVYCVSNINININMNQQQFYKRKYHTKCTFLQQNKHFRFILKFKKNEKGQGSLSLKFFPLIFTLLVRFSFLKVFNTFFFCIINIISISKYAYILPCLDPTSKLILYYHQALDCRQQTLQIKGEKSKKEILSTYTDGLLDKCTLRLTR